MKNKIIIIVLMIISLSLIGYILYSKINDNKNAKDKFSKINVEILSMDDPAIIPLAGDKGLGISGKMNISYDEDIYSAVIFTGQCFDENGYSHDMYGPARGQVSFHNGDTEYSLASVMTQEEQDWSKIKIKSCMINSATAYIEEVNETTGLSTITYTVSTNINYKKTF